MIYGKSVNSLWKLCLAITALSFVIQVVPLLGLVSHFFLTPWWPTLFLNAAFIFMAADALWGCKHRRLLLGPMIWFGGYAVVAGISYVQFHVMNRAANTMNEQSLPSWNKSSNSLLIINGPNDSNYASDLRKDEFVGNFNIDEVFSSENSSIRLIRQPCPKAMGIGRSNGVIYSPVRRGDPLSKEPMQTANGICMVSGPAIPPSNVISVRAHEIEYHEGLVEGITQDFDILVPGRPPFTVRSVTVSPLPWIPRPVAGCHFKGGYGDQWDSGCHAYFGHPSWRRYETTPLKVVAHALGLKAATIEERMPNLTWSPS
jgi:hypothetical protein